MMWLDDLYSQPQDWNLWLRRCLINGKKLLLHNYSCGFTNVHLLQIDLIKMNLEISVGPTRKNWVFLSTGISEYVSLEPKANREKAKPRLKDPNDILSVTKSDHTWSQIYSQAFQLPEPINQYISLITYARLNLIFSVIYKIITGTSLVVQWLRLHLPRQGMQIRSPVWKLRSHMLQGQKSKTFFKSNIVTNSIKTFKMVHIKRKPSKFFKQRKNKTIC